MSKNCGCNGDNESMEMHDHECSCGHDHEEYQTIHLTLDDGTEMECIVIGTYDIDEQGYIALVEEDDDQVMIYKFEELDDESIDLINIEDDEEFDLASQAFFELFVDDEEE